MDAIKAKIVDDWRLVWRKWSFRFTVIGTAITSFLVAFPDSALTAWAMLPAELKAVIPPKYMPFVGIAFYVLAMASKYAKQAKLDELRADK